MGANWISSIHSSSRNLANTSKHGKSQPLGHQRSADQSRRAPASRRKGTRNRRRRKKLLLRMDKMHFAPPTKPWNDDSFPYKYQPTMVSLLSKWCRISSIHSMGVPQTCRCDRQRMRGMTPINEPPVVPSRESLGSFHRSLLIAPASKTDTPLYPGRVEPTRFVTCPRF